MTDQSKDEPVLPPRLHDAARGHHAPPAPPVEVMWGAIARERARRRPAMRSAGPLRYWPFAAGIAAALLVGVTLGGYYFRPHPGTVVPTQVARAPQKDLFVRAVAGQTLDQAEVLLTQYRADALAGNASSTTPADARRLLTATRLLLDSPSISDPRLRGLLEDLELVLAQIAEGSDVKEDRAVITEGLDRRDVLPRLRAAMPVSTGIQLPGAI